MPHRAEGSTQKAVGSKQEVPAFVGASFTRFGESQQYCHPEARFVRAEGPLQFVSMRE